MERQLCTLQDGAQHEQERRKLNARINSVRAGKSLCNTVYLQRVQAQIHEQRG